MTFLIIAPYKYSYLLTYLLSSVELQFQQVHPLTVVLFGQVTGRRGLYVFPAQTDKGGGLIVSDVTHPVVLNKERIPRLLSQTSAALAETPHVLRVIEYFAKSLKVIGNSITSHTIGVP